MFQNPPDRYIYIYDFLYVSESTTGRLNGAVTAALSLASSMVMNESLWKVKMVTSQAEEQDVDKDEARDIYLQTHDHFVSLRWELTDIVMSFCRNITHCGLSVYPTQVSHNQTGPPDRKEPIRSDTNRFTNTLTEPPACHLRHGSTPSNHEGQCPSHTPLAATVTLGPLQAVSIVVALVSCGHVCGHYWKDAMEVR